MNILVIAKLADHTLSENILQPLLSSQSVDRIYVLRDMPGADLGDRVTYLPSSGQQGKLRHLLKIKQGVRCCRENKIGAIIGVLNTPHGYIGTAIGLLTRLPYIHVTIAGHREFWVDGKMMERINLFLIRHLTYRVTVTGEQTRNYLLKNGISSDKIVVLRNLPNMDYMKITVPEDKARTYDFVSFSRVDKNKNIGLLMRAAAKIRPTVQFRIVVAGDGDELENLKMEVQSLGLTDCVDFIGYISAFPDKVKVYSDSKIFVSTSKGEGFPVSLLEAMACGCVPVVSNVGDIVDMIKPDVNGYVFNETDDAAELTQCLLALCGNDEKISRMSQEAQKVKQQISVENNGKVWDTIFTGLASK